VQIFSQSDTRPYSAQRYAKQCTIEWVRHHQLHPAQGVLARALFSQQPPSPSRVASSVPSKPHGQVLGAAGRRLGKPEELLVACLFGLFLYININLEKNAKIGN